jgi:hypothetical protein
MLERIKAFFAKLFSRIRQKPKAEDIKPVAQQATIVAPQSLEDWLASLPPSTRAFIPVGREREYRDSLIAAQNASGSVNRSGNDISDGAPRTFVLSNGQTQTVTFNRGGIVRVIGTNSQIRSLTDFETRALAGTIAGYERQFQGPGSYTFSAVFAADSGSGEVAVTLR